MSDDVKVPVSQVYQLLVGRIVYLEDREELMDKWREDSEEVLQGFANDIARLDNRMDDLWDAVLNAMEDFDRKIPARKTGVSYPAQTGPQDTPKKEYYPF